MRADAFLIIVLLGALLSIMMVINNRHANKNALYLAAFLFILCIEAFESRPKPPYAANRHGYKVQQACIPCQKQANDRGIECHYIRHDVILCRAHTPLDGQHGKISCRVVVAPPHGERIKVRHMPKV